MENSICIVSGYFPTHPGGAEYQAYLLGRILKKNGYEVKYISIGNYNDHIEQHGEEYIHYIGTKYQYGPLGKTYVLLYKKLRNILADMNVDYVYQRGAYSVTGILARLSRIIGYKFVWACASEADYTHANLRDGKLLNAIEKIGKEYGIRNSDEILVQTEEQKVAIKKKYGKESILVRNAHPIPEVQKKDIGVTRLIFIGNLKKMKRPEVFIRMANEIGGRKDIEFYMVGRRGTTKWQAGINRLIDQSKFLIYFGEKKQEEVNGLLQKSHILVNTSSYEGFPNTYIQAWLREVPVISMGVDPDGLIIKHEMGCVASTYNQMKENTINLIHNSLARKRMGQNAREYAIENHSIDKAERDYLKIFQQGVI